MAGCHLPSAYYQKQETIPKNEWTYNNKPSFTFEITDTTSDYRPFFLIQHTQAYPYNNLWLWMYVKAPGDSAVKKWLGRGMGEIYEQRMAINLDDSLKFRKPGVYQVSLEQNMRINPLPEVLHVGLRVEKIPRKL
jgi:gliding motility-associated lipoprotein GldH